MSEAEELVEALRAEFKRYAFLRPVRRRVRLLLLPFQDGASAERKRKKRIIIHEAEAVEADIGGFRVGSVAQEEAGVVEKAQQPPSADVALPISALFSVGDIVEVARRMWPGINKPGGTARCHFACTSFTSVFLNMAPCLTGSQGWPKTTTGRPCTTCATR